MSVQTAIDADEVLDWLKNEAARQGVKRFSATFIRKEGERWLYFAVGLGEKDISRRADIVIGLKDAWEEANPNTYKLALRPSKVNE